MKKIKEVLGLTVKAGPCDCNCGGCDGGYGHCGKAARGCGWKR